MNTKSIKNFGRDVAQKIGNPLSKIPNNLEISKDSLHLFSKTLEKVSEIDDGLMEQELQKFFDEVSEKESISDEELNKYNLEFDILKEKKDYKLKKIYAVLKCGVIFILVKGGEVVLCWLLNNKPSSGGGSTMTGGSACKAS